MEPAFQRGDILFLTNQDAPIRVGEIVVFKIKDRDIPIVHRVMKVKPQAVPAPAPAPAPLRLPTPPRCTQMPCVDTIS